MAGEPSLSKFDWSIAGLQALIEAEVAEGITFELKRDLQTADGAAGWRKRRAVHASERDGLAKEIVAFANAYGGVVVVGIHETEDHPKGALSLADPLPKIHDLVSRLREALSAVIDPPIPNLDLFAIPTSQESEEGYLVVRVQPSTAAPHGVGRPPSAYVRRDDRAEPMTMRDIQSVFWEARTRRERIEAELATLRAHLDAIEITNNNIGFYLGLIAEQPLQMRTVAKDLRRGTTLNYPSTIYSYGPSGVADNPANNYKWSPTARGARYEDDRTHAVWDIDDTGVFSVFGQAVVHGDPDRNISTFYPGWFCKTAGSLVGLGDLLARRYNLESDWVLAGGFHSHATRLVASLGRSIGDGDKQVDLTSPSVFRGIRISEIDAVETEVVVSERIWQAFGMMRPDEDVGFSSGLREIRQFSSLS